MEATRLTIGELELSIHANKNEFASLVKFGETAIDVEYEFERGQEEIIRADPDDSQPGWPDAITICSIKAARPMAYEAEGLALVVARGTDIYHLLSKDQVERLEEEILEGMRAEA